MPVRREILQRLSRRTGGGNPFAWRMRYAAGWRPLNVNSGVRCKRHNAEVGGVSNSLHTTGQAVDLSGAISPEKLYAIAQDVQAKKIPGRGGLGLYGWGIHEDNGKYSRWNG